MYEAVKSLNHELYQLAKINAETHTRFIRNGIDVDQIDYDMVDWWCRNAVSRHTPVNPAIQRSIDSRFKQSPFGRSMKSKKHQDILEYTYMR